MAPRRKRLSAAEAAIEVVHLAPTPRARATSTGTDTAVVFNDTHHPQADQRTLGIIYKTCEELKPRIIVGNGDIPDLRNLSRHLKDKRIGRTWELRDEQRAAKSMWRELAGIGSRWGVRLVETEANHSGNGPESRLFRYLTERAPELFELDGIEKALDYRRFFHPEDVRVELVESITLANSLLVMHGSIARAHGGMSARGHGEELNVDVLIGHTHRQGYSARGYAPVRGIRSKERTRRVWESGHCTIRQDYAPRADWVPGFAIVHMDERNDSYNVELVNTTNGRAVVNTLGRSIAA